MPTSQTAASVSSLTDSQEDEEGVYKYPPLKATKAGLDENINVEIDQEERNSGSRPSASENVGRGPSSDSFTQEDTPDISSSSEDSVEESTGLEVKENAGEQMLGHRLDGQDVGSRDDPQDFVDRAKEMKQRIMYLSSDVSDKQSDLDDSSVTVAENTTASDRKAASKTSSPQQPGSERLKDSKLESGGNLLSVSLEEESEQGLTVLCVSKYIFSVLHLNIVRHIGLVFPSVFL